VNQPEGSFGDSWRRGPGIFVIAELRGEVGEWIRAIQLRYDPKLAAGNPPHITLAGSSGIGPIAPQTTMEELRSALEPVARDTPPLALQLEPPMRFMQTDIVVVPLDPHGAIRTLHERIARSGLKHERARFSFTPHATLTFYRTLTPVQRQELLRLRWREPIVIDAITVSLTNEPQVPRTLLELALGGKDGRA